MSPARLFEAVKVAALISRIITISYVGLNHRPLFMEKYTGALLRFNCQLDTSERKDYTDKLSNEIGL